MESRIVSMQAFTVVGGHYRGKNENEEIPNLWRMTGPRFAEIESMVGDHRAYGVCDNFDEKSHEFDYVAGVEVTAAENIPNGMVRWDIPAATYVVVACTLPTLKQAFQHAYGTWLPESGYRKGPGPEYELYDKEFDATDPHSPMYIYIPIEKAT